MRSVVDVLRTVETIGPANLNGYGYRGELGVVRPHVARRFLVQAYRGMTGAAPLPVVARRSPSYDATSLHQLFPKSEWALKTKYWY